MKAVEIGADSTRSSAAARENFVMVVAVASTHQLESFDTRREERKRGGGADLCTILGGPSKSGYVWRNISL